MATRDINQVTTPKLLTTQIKVRLTLLAKSHHPPSSSPGSAIQYASVQYNVI